MKVRSDYVSNSSSSSFIVIAKDGTDETQAIMDDFRWHDENWKALEIPCSSAKHEFGWEWEDTHEFLGKLNFVAIQLLYLYLQKSSGRKSMYAEQYSGADFTRLYDMLIKVCKEKFGISVRLNVKIIHPSLWKGEDGDYPTGDLVMDTDYYIDHQSCVTEDCCMEMFESEEALYDFLRFEESYVRGGNDNG